MNTRTHIIDSVERLGRDDLDEALHLSTQADWNQTATDWLRLLELNPDCCFKYRKEDRIVGTATIAAYGRTLAWIGMVLVDKQFRGKGLGKRILETTIREARRRGYNAIGLDATDLGRPLYLDYGFHDVHPIDRWSGTMTIGTPSGDPVRSPCEDPIRHPDRGVHPLDDERLQQAMDLDLRWSGCDRQPLIRRLYDEKTTRSLSLTRDGRLCGYAFLRSGREFYHLGPLLAETPGDCDVLLNAAAESLKGEPVLVDAVRRQETTAFFKRYGLKVQRRLTRMTLEAPKPVLDNPKLRVAASFEWG